MYILDVVIVLIFARFFVNHKNYNFLYYFINSLALFGGYILGLILSVAVAKNIADYNEIGIVAACLMPGLAILFRISVAIIRKIAKYKTDKFQPTPTSQLFNISRRLVLPYKILMSLISVFLLSQTLFYIPLDLVQSLAQGSGLMITTARILPDTLISNTAKKLSTNQFEKLKLSYDNGPILSIDTSKAGEFKSVVDKIAPSIVRIAASRCGFAGYNGVGGSGSFIGKNLVITNQHVINGASSIYIVNKNGTYPAIPIVIDEDHDIAVLYSRYVDSPAIPINTTRPPAGTTVMSLGYPGTNNQNFSLIASNVESSSIFKSWQRKLDSNNTFSLAKGLGPGSSGGPVINLSGEIVGINAASDGMDLIAINSNIAKKSIDEANIRLFPAFSPICAYDAHSY
jgi:hypothetical protein